ncbi:MAG TPA: hypothetical protein VFK82_10095 [Burkholderiaceae bacterium]|nr:hypothetical protein [Burkholderiaceae bacterium]
MTERWLGTVLPSRNARQQLARRHAPRALMQRLCRNGTAMDTNCRFVDGRKVDLQSNA